jgi:biopolymer transport protein ExbD
VRQGKLVLNNDANKRKDDEPLNEREIKIINVLTLNSINWEMNSLKPENLLTIPQPKTMPLPLTNNDFIINRVGQTKGCSLLESDFDFKSHEVMPSHHFVVCSPRTIILDKLPFFHAVLEIFVNELASNKLKIPKNETPILETTKQKSTYVTVKEIQEIEVEIPSANFDILEEQFNQYYNMYATSYKNYITADKNLNNHKLELAKFLKKKIDGNK